MRNSKVYEFVLAAMFSVLIAICAWITIPFVVPFTMQTFGVFLAIAVLGGKMASISIALYIFMGIMGIPVFSGFQSGLGILLGTTGGYVVGFLVAAMFIWAIDRLIYKDKLGRKRNWILITQMFVGLLTCYGFGTLWFWGIYMKTTGEIGIGSILAVCVLPFVIPDIIKVMLAYMVAKRLRKIRYLG